MPSSFELVKATEQDASDMASCFFDAFTRKPHPQADFYRKMFPNRPNVHKFFEASFIGQMQQEKNAIFLKAVDVNADNKIAGFIKWIPPNSQDSFWSDYGEDQDAALCDAFFGAMADNRARLMGNRPHWFIELMGVSSEYHRQGAGSMLINYGCNLADKDGIEAYVDASPIAEPLYKRFGFETKNKLAMPAPFDWYLESFMIRPGKNE